MSSSGKTDYLLNGARVVQLDDGVIQFSQSFPVTGGAVNMGPSAQVTLTETGRQRHGSTWVTHWHLVVSSEDLNGTASAITTLVDDAGIGPSVAVYAAVSAECISSNMSQLIEFRCLRNPMFVAR